MEWITIAIVVTALIVFFLLNQKNQSNGVSNEFLMQLNSQLREEIQAIRREAGADAKETRVELEQKLSTITKGISDYQRSSNQSITQQFVESKKAITDVTRALSEIKGTNEQVLSFANQMKTLEKILGNSKQRGILGEIQLENLLANVLPPELFQMQYKFANDEIVDAIVKVGDFIIPVDAKFSLDNYNKMVESSDAEAIKVLEQSFKSDIKKRIDETSKYIRPNESTTDYAYMFIPADGLYQDLLNSRVGSLSINSRDLVSYAYEKKVMIVSPMSLFPMLQITVKALHNLKIENSIQDILKNVGRLSQHLNAFEDAHSRMGKSIGTVVNHYNASAKEFKKIDKDIIRLAGEENALDYQVDALDRPNFEE